MPLQDYYNKHKPKMPKLSKGAKTASKETDDAEEEDDEEEEEEEEEDSPKKDIKTGEDQDEILKVSQAESVIILYK